MNYLARMEPSAHERPLKFDSSITEEDRLSAAKLKSIWDANKKRLGLTQELFAANYRDGVTQGNISHYLNAHRALNLNAVVAFADASSRMSPRN